MCLAQHTEKAAHEYIACQGFTSVVGERFTVGQHDHRYILRRHLEIQRGKSGAPVTVVPDHSEAVIVRDEPTQSIRQALAAVGNEIRPGFFLGLFLHEYMAIDGGVVLCQVPHGG